MTDNEMHIALLEAEICRLRKRNRKLQGNLKETAEQAARSRAALRQEREGLILRRTQIRQKVLDAHAVVTAQLNAVTNGAAPLTPHSLRETLLNTYSTLDNLVNSMR